MRTRVRRRQSSPAMELILEVFAERLVAGGRESTTGGDTVHTEATSRAINERGGRRASSSRVGFTSLLLREGMTVELCKRTHREEL